MHMGKTVLMFAYSYFKFWGGKQNKQESHAIARKPCVFPCQWLFDCYLLQHTKGQWPL